MFVAKRVGEVTAKSPPDDNRRTEQSKLGKPLELPGTDPVDLFELVAFVHNLAEDGFALRGDLPAGL
ncbi:MAG: hypothetical protein E5W02_06490 [Mesorhizobium sp.]|nr:MAG: hypothetical protein E5W02_06490 [Mesorhizobium sp.]